MNSICCYVIQVIVIDVASPGKEIIFQAQKAHIIAANAYVCCRGENGLLPA